MKHTIRYWLYFFLAILAGICGIITVIKENMTLTIILFVMMCYFQTENSLEAIKEKIGYYDE